MSSPLALCVGALLALSSLSTYAEAPIYREPAAYWEAAGTPREVITFKWKPGRGSGRSR